MSSSAAKQFRFAEGEKVLCFHGPLLYEAKCIKSQVKDKLVKYFIHYSGWNKNWDEWVPESRVLKFNDANLQKQKELEKAHVKTKKPRHSKLFPGKLLPRRESEGEKTPTPQEKPKPKPAATTTSASSASPSTSAEGTADTRKKRTRGDQNVENEEEYVQKLDIKVRVPDDLKIWLVDDWDYVTRQKKLVHLPARITAEFVLEEYVKQRLSEKGWTPIKAAAINEVASGIREYFNVMLGKQLLYKFERPQYQDMLAEYPDKPMSEVYGSVHLLRLFSRIGAVLAYTPLDDDSVTLLLLHFQDFVKFMSRPSHTLLSLSDYEVASPEYQRRAA